MIANPDDRSESKKSRIALIKDRVLRFFFQQGGAAKTVNQSQSDVAVATTAKKSQKQQRDNAIHSSFAS